MGFGATYTRGFTVCYMLLKICHIFWWFIVESASMQYLIQGLVTVHPFCLQIFYVPWFILVISLFSIDSFPLKGYLTVPVKYSQGHKENWLVADRKEQKHSWHSLHDSLNVQNPSQSGKSIIKLHVFRIHTIMKQTNRHLLLLFD